MDPTGTLPTTPSDICEQRSWLIPLGLLLAVLGGIAIFAAFAATLATVLVFGVLLLIGGGAQLAHAFGARSEDFAWELFGGLLYLLTGGLLIYDPVSGAVGLTLLLAVFFLFVGIVRISLGVRMRRARGFGGAFLLSGGLDAFLGVLIVLGWPQTAAWVIGLFLGLELLFAGVSLLMLAHVARRGGDARRETPSLTV